mgnify:CR=1 FL=1
MNETIVRPAHLTREKQQHRRQPQYHVVLVNDEDHTFDYVIRMCKVIFGHQTERGYQIAKQVDQQGRAIVWTGTFELAELKQDQIHGFGADPLVTQSQGSMSAELEPA